MAYIWFESREGARQSPVRRMQDETLTLVDWTKQVIGLLCSMPKTFKRKLATARYGAYLVQRFRHLYAQVYTFERTAQDSEEDFLAEA